MASATRCTNLLPGDLLGHCCNYCEGCNMKEVTIDTVKARIAELEGADQLIGLGLHAEFELACLRKLLAGMEQKPYGYAELYDFPRTTATLYPDQDRYATMPLYAEPPAPVSMPDAATAIRACIDEFPESVRDIVEECASIAENACRAAMLQGAEQSPVTDNTAQQFEALATIGKSEHLLNAERIAREAKALADRLNATSAVDPRVSGWSERQQKVIAYSLWRFSCTAYQKANQAAQANNKDMFDRFIRDARCAEEIREEFNSAWGGKL